MRRRRLPELMDDPLLDRSAHAAALRSLEQTNRTFATEAPIAAAIAEVDSRESVSILDVGAGGGDLLDRLSRRLRSRAMSGGNGRHMLPAPAHTRTLLPRIGIDVSLQALQLARSWRGSEIAWVCADARRLPFRDRGIDWVLCTLMLHHLDPPDVITLLKEASRVCRVGLVVMDLSRSRLSWLSTWLVTRLVSRSHVFHVDGPRSVRAAFRPTELRSMAVQAGLRSVIVRRRFPFRLLLTWYRPAFRLKGSDPS